MTLRRTAVAALLIAGAIATVLAGFALWLYAAFERPHAAGPAVTIVVPRGAGLDEIARLLQQRGVVEDRLPFLFGVQIAGMAPRLRAGEYAFPAAISPRAAMELLASGRTVVRRLTIAEGLTTAQVLRLVSEADGLSGEVTRRPSEGALLPETYNYSFGDARDGLVARMERAMRETLDGLWAARRPELPLKSPHEAVILASIVERETGVAAERAKIAGVFYNRLARGMRLQSDPTVAYAAALAEGRPLATLERALTRADLAAAHPYNTYASDGLPPGPIANPGRASLLAVMNPDRTDALYFVADGSGGHAFARTLDEHNRNVARWRQIERARGENKN